MKALVYVQNRDERSQIRPFLSRFVPGITMVNSAAELLEHLKSPRSYDMLILDDSFDAKSPDGESLFEGPSVPEILQEIQAGYTGSPDVTILTLLRPVVAQDEHSTVSVFVDTSVQDREHLYTELGSSLFLAKPFNTEALNKALAELVRATNTPPIWIKALKQVRQLYTQKMYTDVLGFVDKLAAAGHEQKHLGFSLLRAKCLMQMGGERVGDAIQVLQGLRQSSPKSLSVRMLLLDAYLKLGRLEEAFDEQLGIFATQKTSFNFDKALNLMGDIFERARLLNASDERGGEELLLQCAQKFMDQLFRDPAPYSRRLRPRLFEMLAERLQSTESWVKVLPMIKRSDDVIEAISETLCLALRKIETELLQRPDDIGLKLDFEEGHVLLLKVFPTEPRSLEIATDALLERGSVEELDKLLKTAELAGAKSLEFYLALSRYFLKIDNLKEASDVLHKAVRIRADDSRVVELRQIWQALYDERNKAAAA